MQDYENKENRATKVFMVSASIVAALLLLQVSAILTFGSRDWTQFAMSITPCLIASMIVVWGSMFLRAHYINKQNSEEGVERDADISTEQDQTDRESKVLEFKQEVNESHELL